VTLTDLLSKVLLYAVPAWTDSGIDTSAGDVQLKAVPSYVKLSQVEHAGISDLSTFHPIFAIIFCQCVQVTISSSVKVSHVFVAP
jgi:hypothetical protein